MAAGVWVKGWRREWPVGLKAKARYAAALTWVCVLRCAIRIIYRFGWRPST